MKFIDVTLRDGGHQHNFNWPLDFVKRYLESLNSFDEIEFVELGYWKQSGKFDPGKRQEKINVLWKLVT